MDFGQSNAEIGWKMANGQLLFLALPIPPHSQARHAMNQTMGVDMVIIIQVHALPCTTNSQCPLSPYIRVDSDLTHKPCKLINKCPNNTIHNKIYNESYTK